MNEDWLTLTLPLTREVVINKHVEKGKVKTEFSDTNELRCYKVVVLQLESFNEFTPLAIPGCICVRTKPQHTSSEINFQS